MNPTNEPIVGLTYNETSEQFEERVIEMITNRMEQLRDQAPDYVPASRIDEVLA